MKNTLADDELKLKVIRDSIDGLNYSQIAREYSLDKKTIRMFLTKQSWCDWWENFSPPASGKINDHHNSIEPIGKKKKYIFTSAQNNTYVNKNFLKSLELYAEQNDAEIVVGTFSYNTKGFQNLEKSDGDWFDPLIEKYIVDEPKKIFDGLLWLGELNILPTAIKPLNGLSNYTKLDSAIVPHAKLQLESVPTHKQHDTKFLFSTGAVTLQNYIQKFSGQKASFHHVFGALIAEVDKEGDWFVRQLVADKSGGFYDLDKYYHHSSGVVSDNVLAINYGDVHAEKGDDQIFEAAFGCSDSMLDCLKPSYQFVHDVLDFSSRNHHTISDPYFRFKSFITGNDSVIKNIESVSEVLKTMRRDFCETVIVESNHDLAIERWLKTADYKNDPANAILFLELQLAKYKSIQNNDKRFSVLKHALTYFNNYSDQDTFLKVDESFTLVDCYGGIIECGCHGHLGNNGARPSITSFSKLGTRYNIGHSHSATIFEGVYQAGVLAKLDLGYNTGGSSWSWSSIVTYKNGKRAIVTMRKSKTSAKWRA